MELSWDFSLQDSYNTSSHCEYIESGCLLNLLSASDNCFSIFAWFFTDDILLNFFYKKQYQVALSKILMTSSTRQHAERPNPLPHAERPHPLLHAERPHPLPHPPCYLVLGSRPALLQCHRPQGFGIWGAGLPGLWWGGASGPHTGHSCSQTHAVHRQNKVGIKVETY